MEGLLIDRLLIHLAPVLLGEGVRLVDHLGEHVRLAQTAWSRPLTLKHLSYDVIR